MSSEEHDTRCLFYKWDKGLSPYGGYLAPRPACTCALLPPWPQEHALTGVYTVQADVDGELWAAGLMLRKGDPPRALADWVEMQRAMASARIPGAELRWLKDGERWEPVKA